ncbi:MAG: MBL fold metallo-hydrolase [Daejeonella sp.]
MSLYISSINSGSNGNCYYVGNQQTAVLIDVGISCREVEKRFARMGLSMKIVKAIFISHEHSDHIKGLTVLSSKYRIPVYVSTGTLRNLPCSVDAELIRIFKGSENIKIDEITITPFYKIHDAYDPHSFMLSYNKVNVGVFTDLGRVCKNLTKYFKKCHAAFLETNYDETMLDQGRYPYFLKNRIRGGSGHLSNREALDLFINHRPEFLSHLLLSHLSKDNNCVELVEELFNKHTTNTQITVAGRYQETSVYLIEPAGMIKKAQLVIKQKPAEAQLSLF